MGRPGKRAKASKANGSMASNAGKIASERTTVIRAVFDNRKAKYGWYFEKVLRAKLHKNERYADELKAQELLLAAEWAVVAADLPTSGQEHVAGMQCEVAQAILAAFDAVVGDAA
jgi:hypothetical protein